MDREVYILMMTDLGTFTTQKSPAAYVSKCPSTSFSIRRDFIHKVLQLKVVFYVFVAVVIP